MRLRADDHTPVTSKVEVGGGFAEVDLSDKKTMWVEDMNTIAYARVNIPIGVGMNTYHLVSGIVRKKIREIAYRQRHQREYRRRPSGSPRYHRLVRPIGNW